MPEEKNSDCEEKTYQSGARLIEECPDVPEEVVTALLEKDPSLRQQYQPGETSAENYRKRVYVYIQIDDFMEQCFPQRFQTPQDTHKAQLVALNEKIAALA